jgi:SAM-dependent methyltransferase
MKKTSSRLGGWFFFLLSYLKRTAFLLLRIATLPAQVLFFITRPHAKKFGYEDLLRMRTRHPAKAWGTTDAKQYQANYAGRVASIARLYESKRILEVGCGNGLAATILQQAGFDVSANDVVDILDPAARQAGVNFLQGDVCQGLSYPEADFDLTFSVNSFEHFYDPAAALDEILRVTRPGGLIHLSFDPLYFSPWGLHASRRLGFPYPQVLFSEANIQRFVDEKSEEIAQTYDPTSDRTRIGPPLNHWTLEQYRQIFQQRGQTLKLIIYNERIALEGLGMLITHTGVFKAYAPSFMSLIVSGINLLARKM